MFWVTLAGVLVVIAYTSVAAWQACLTRRQLNEMQIEQRAWVSAPKIEILADPKKVKVTAYFTNVGKTQALVWVGAEIADQGVITMCDRMQQEFAAHRQTHPKDTGFYLIPGGTYAESNFPDGNDLRMIDRARIENAIEPYVNGCVVYSDGVDDLPHQTGFWAAIDKKTMSAPIVNSRDAK